MLKKENGMTRKEIPRKNHIFFFFAKVDILSKRCTCHRDISQSPDAADSVIAAFRKRFQLVIDLQFVEFQPLAVCRRLTSWFFFLVFF